jgi:hypothetical protein
MGLSEFENRRIEIILKRLVAGTKAVLIILLLFSSAFTK